MTTTYRCELAWLGGDGAEPDIRVDVDGERITAVRAGETQWPEGTTRLDGLTVPGFANAHSHAFHRALRGSTQRRAGSFWAWRRAMYDVAESLDPDRYFLLARAVYGEMVLAGITTVGEFHYLHHQQGGKPYDHPNAMGEALIAAAAESGLRITLLDACYLHGGIGTGPDATQRRFSDGDPGAWAQRVDGLEEAPGVRLGAAIHSVRAVDPGAMELVASWAGDRRAPLHAHLSEQPAENEQCRAAFGCTPTELLDRNDVLGERFTAVHATHVSAADIEALGAAGCWCCLCPTTERDLADGIGPAGALRAAGVQLTVGTDSQAVIDMLEETRAVELDERLATGARGGHETPALLRMATAHGHTCLGWDHAGRIEPGALADLVSIRLDSVRTAGADPINALDVAVFAATSADVHHVVIGGATVVKDGRHLTLDVAAELSGALRSRS